MLRTGRPRRDRRPAPPAGLGTGPIELESTRVIEGAGVTHLEFRVVK
jgi:hypothetical protein